LTSISGLLLIYVNGNLTSISGLLLTYVNGNLTSISGLLLAYVNGNGNLCRALVRAGSKLGTMNKQGLNIFNAPVATKQLLFKLLGKLPWKSEF
jgi:hypothetical protein